MEQANFPIINPDELILLSQKQTLVIIDARAGPDAKANTQAQHLKERVCRPGY
jgi:hypothetical protein